MIRVQLRLVSLCRAVGQWLLLLLLCACGGGSESVNTVSLTAGTDGSEADLTPVTFTVSLSGVNDTGASIAVNYYFAGGTATGNNIDYDSIAARVWIADGSRKGVISVPVKQDLLAENRETVQVVLSKTSHTSFALSDTANTYTAGIIDDDAPHIVAVDSKGVGGYYYTGDVLTFYVQYEDSVAVTGTPRLGFKLGANTDHGPLSYAHYVAGTGTDTLTFAYTVLSTDTDADGIVIPLAPLDGDQGATITSVSGTINVLTDTIEAGDLRGFAGQDPDADAVLNHYADYDGDGVRGDEGDRHDYWAMTSRINHYPNAHASYTQVPRAVLPDGTTVVPSARVMTWEGKSDAGQMLVSQPGGQPWTNLDWPTAKDKCTGVGNLLMGENQWLAIAHNTLQQDVNWTGGEQGHGLLKRGHSDAQSIGLGDTLPGENNPLAGTSNDRVLQLSNGEIIWDLAGNVWEWVYMDAGLPGAASGLGSAGTYVGYPQGIAAAQVDYVNLEHEEVINPNIKPDATWVANSAEQGVGRIRIDDNTSRPFVRGGNEDVSKIAGILALDTTKEQASKGAAIGFRCANQH